MRLSLEVVARSLFGVAFIIIVIGSYVIVAQTAVTGEWKADTSNTKHAEEGKLHISFERSTSNGHKNQHGTNYSYSDLQGLTREQTANGRVAFRLVREAGTIDCTGSFAGGRGSGTFVFTPNPAFVSGMQSRGYSLSDEKQFASTTLDLRLSFVDDLRSAGFNSLTVDDLFKARIFNITPQFMAEMTATGFPDLGMEDLVKARIFKIDAAYVSQVASMGFGSRNMEELVKFKIFKVTPEFLSELTAVGLSNLSSEDVVKIRIFKIDADFVRSARAADPNISVEDMVKMKIGVYRLRNSD